jgi:hypothetical protein
LETSVNYFLGNDPAQWRAHVPVWAGVRYVDLYPGVDLEVTGEAGRWSWRLVVRTSTLALPLFGGGNEGGGVRLRVEGADAVELLPSPAVGRGAGGEGLLLRTALGEFTLPLLAVEGVTARQPAVQAVGAGRFEISAPFTARDAAAGGRPSGIGAASASDLAYATFLGGSHGDGGNDIAVDGSGAAYVMGGTYSTDFPATPGAFDTTCNIGYYCNDVFVVRLSPSGSSLL